MTTPTPGGDLTVRWYVRPLSARGFDLRVAVADGADHNTHCPVCESEDESVHDELLQVLVWSCRRCGTRWAVVSVIDLLHRAVLHGLARWRDAHPGQRYPLRVWRGDRR